jgi:sterol 24-C-methyltransferase
MTAPEKTEAPGIAQLLATVPAGARADASMKDYLAHHSGGATDRQADYAKVVNGYFDLATDFYEYGWGQSFHFAQQAEGETFREAILRHERRLALALALRPDMTALDVGCGVGGPMRNIARLAGCSIIGINNNAYQLLRLERLNAEVGLAGRCSGVPGDFMAMPFPDGAMDAAYAIEATVHAPNWLGVFREVYRCLKPGASFALYDWCLTGSYDDGDPGHRDIKRRIVEGNGLIDIGTAALLQDSLRQAGFELIEHFDAAQSGGTPWYEPLAPSRLSFAGFRSSAIGRKVTNNSLRLLELLRVVPKGAADVAVFLDRAAVALVAGGRAGIFTPMYFLHARKPG